MILYTRNVDKFSRSLCLWHLRYTTLHLFFEKCNVQERNIHAG
jgi:hypothetical protein